MGCFTQLFASCVAFIFDLSVSYHKEPELRFVTRNGTQIMLDGKPLYLNGWNSYWLMGHAVHDYSRPRVGPMLQAGAKMGLTVFRICAFNDEPYHALQISPGKFDERVFKREYMELGYCLAWLTTRKHMGERLSMSVGHGKELFCAPLMIDPYQRDKL